MIRHNEIALLVSPGDVAGFVRAIDELSRDPVLYRRLATKGRQYAQDRLSYASFRSKIESTILTTTDAPGLRLDGIGVT